MEPRLTFAETDDGMKLPVVDVTNPAFAVTKTDAEITAMAEQFLEETAARGELPPAVVIALQQSKLGRALINSRGSFLSGLNTYLLKVGAENLGSGFTEIDRRIAGSFPGQVTRIRLQDMVVLLSESLAPILKKDPRRPLRLINIAGGPGADSWNALIVLRAGGSGLLDERELSIDVLDLDEEGPRFGARAVDALRSPKDPLAALSLVFRRTSYDWANADALPKILENIGAAGSVCAVSSEGGLFEYGSDAIIAANLKALALATPPDTIIIGSVTRAGEHVRLTQAANAIATVPRTLEAFRALADDGGWFVQRVIERPFSYDLRLAKLQ